MKKVKIKTVKPESITNIEVSGEFLRVLENFLQRTISNKSEEEAIALFTDMKSADDDMSLMEEDTKDVYILMSLIKAIETKFEEEGKVIEEEVSY